MPGVMLDLKRRTEPSQKTALSCSVTARLARPLAISLREEKCPTAGEEDGTSWQRDSEEGRDWSPVHHHDGSNQTRDDESA